jgi:zinc and cadmium transporter
VLVYSSTIGVATAEPSLFLGAILSFAAGAFVCIASSDLLPELQFHSHDRIKLSAFLLLGVALSIGIVFLERSTHSHGEPGDAHHAHDHHAHEHHAADEHAVPSPALPHP